ncbi:cytochrome C biogenesis protein ResB [Orrella marina]|uniref:Cytochrome C biogenesis protein ResB n=2 Tax=Orrella marina TaxID=2163011 RepID=A0A2R4XLF7_9BURK|nr:cytochrome c biogenesis protein ResB [Orrella marina]AWB34640.1 cytochrome C biogenesis protein ResB [Orrella marina]
MRFAIYLLVIICVASIIGTVLPQNMSENTYIDQFGPFWFDVLSKFSVWSIYNSGWFLVIMTFLVISTTICLIRNTPKMIREMRSFREQVRGSSLRAFRHRVDLITERSLTSCDSAVKKWLQSQGYRFKTREEPGGVMIAAKKGSGNRLGYIFAHASIVIICIGGLLDSELPVRAQVWLLGKTPIVENMLIADVPPEGRLALSNPSFRANLLIPEGATRANAVVNVGEGALVQPLPFELTLNKFIIDYYSTGMPSRFASEVTVRDSETGETFDQTIEVNEPLRYKGVTVYQSSFDDGGSNVDLALYPLSGTQSGPFDLAKRVGESIDFPVGSSGNVRLEITGLRPINVEDLTSGEPQPRQLAEHVAAVTGSAASRRNENLRNVGPSVEFRIIDSSGQATNYHNYMLPVELDGAFVILAGVDQGGGQFSYLRIPVDQDNSAGEFMKLRAALANPEMREEAARRFALSNTSDLTDQEALQLSARRALDTFSVGGLQGLSQFLEKNVSEEELPRAAQVIVRLLGSSIATLRNVVREQENLPVLDAADPGNQQWNQMAVAALSDLQFYPAPVLVTMTSFDHLQASVFQVSRTPGMLTVYLGCLLLTIGVFAMFYVRDRRIWIWLRRDDTGTKTEVLAAMTSQKRTLDFNREFERFKQTIGMLDQKESG